MLKVEFVDGVARAKAHPDTFHIPHKMEKALILPGMNVKVAVETKTDVPGERFWVEVTEYTWSEVNQSGSGKGRVNNDLVYYPELNDQIVEFSCKNVLDILE